VIYAFALVAAVALSLGLLRLLRRRVHPPPHGRSVSVFGVYSPVLTWVSRSLRPAFRQVGPGRLRAALGGKLGFALELLVVALWALWIGRHLLNFDPQVWTTGNEFGSQVYGFHLWDFIRQCGLCGLWNGMVNGGAPSLPDPYSGALHPVPALATLIAGVVNGAKITLVASFWLAGVGQWWIGKTMGLSRWSRLWTALVATSGAYIVGRLEGGNITLPLSTAAVSLALAASLDLALHRSRKAALRFAVLLALAVLAGQGYMQIALLFWGPWIILLILTPGTRPDAVWREFVLGIGLALLLAGIFLVPFLHFWPMAGKFSDPAFVGSQPFQYLPLNLVIHDWDFFMSTALGKLPYPYLNTLYIGWPPVILAILGLGLRNKKDTRLLVSLSLGALTMFWLASGEPFRWLAQLAPAISSVRLPSLMAGLAVPAVLALSGYGLDRVLQVRWPRLGLGVSLGESRSGVSITTAWLLLIPLAATLRGADQFDQNFLGIDDKSDVYQALAAFRTASLEWVSVPYGEHYWDEAAFDEGLKMTGYVAPWWWDGRELPPPRLEATRDAQDQPVSSYLGDVPIYQKPSNVYAFIQSGPDMVPCSAQGVGGDLRVTCESGGGTLVVRENSWSGWSATVNGKKAPLEESQWLSVTVPPGPIEVRFRYLPLDVLVGALLTFVGIVLAVALWIRSNRTPAAPPSPQGTRPD